MADELAFFERTAARASDPERLADSSEDHNSCKDCVERYLADIQEKKTEIRDTMDLIDRMADSLAEIDPNTETGAEGKFLIRKMYKLKGIKP